MRNSNEPGHILVAEIRRGFKEAFQRAVTYEDLFEEAIQVFNNQKQKEGCLLLNEVVKKRKALLGCNHPQTIRSMTLLVEFFENQRINAVPLRRELAMISERRFGFFQPETIVKWVEYGE